MRILLLHNGDRAWSRITGVLETLSFTVEHAAPADVEDNPANLDDYDMSIVDFESSPSGVRQFVSEAIDQNNSNRILVAAKSENIKEIEGLMELGAADFVCKPVFHDELRVRINALATRQLGHRERSLTFGPLHIDTRTQTVYLADESVALTPRERAVLQILLRHQESVVRKDHIASRVFSMDDEATPAAIEVYIHRLRQKLSHPDIEIRTVRGAGYMLTSKA